METVERKCNGDCPTGASNLSIRRTFGTDGSLSTAPVLAYFDSAAHLLRTQTWGFQGETILADTRYDGRGREHEVDQPHSGSEAKLAKRTEYDDLDRPIKVTTLDEGGYALDSTIEYHGTAKTFMNPSLETRSERRDVWGRLLSTTDALGKLTKFEHDAFGNLTKTTDSKNNVVTVKYDNLGRRIELNDPDLGQISYGVDSLGQVSRQQNPKLRAMSKYATFKYDDLGRMTQRAEPELTSNWVWDGANCAANHSCGQLVEASTGDTKDYLRRHAYDMYGRPSVTRFNLKANMQNVSTTAYDAYGRKLSETHEIFNTASPQVLQGTRKVFNYRYNQYGYLARLENATRALWVATSLDAALRQTEATLGNGLVVTRGFDPNTGRQMSGKTVNASATPVLSESYFYDKLGNVEQRSQYWGATGFIETFTYDSLNRLHTSTISGQKQIFEFDDIGNITSKTGVGAYTYAATAGAGGRLLPHAVSRAGTDDYKYDEDGNMLTGPDGRKITWKSFDMPETITKGTISSTFAYGPEHQRSRQTRSDGSVVYYAGSFEVETNGSAMTVKTFWPNGLGFELEKGGGTSLYWTHLDRLGSVVAISNEAGTIPTDGRFAYDSWGQRRALSSQAAGTNANRDFNRGYTGHEMLDDLGLVHMNGRVYDPVIARFTSADAIIQDPEHSQSYNRYTYVWNNPTNLTDPTGFVTQTLSSLEIQSCAQSVGCQTDGKGITATYGYDADGNWVKTNGVDGSGGAGRANRSVHGHDMGRTTFQTYDGISTVSQTTVAGTAGHYHDQEERPHYLSAAGQFGRWFAFDPYAETLKMAGMRPSRAAQVGLALSLISNPRQLLGRAASKIAARKAEQLAAKKGETLIYRAASGTPQSMTPRLKDQAGLSAANSLENALPGKNQIIDGSKLENLCAVCDNAVTGHVSIYPKDPSQMAGWIESRGGDTVHPLTQELMDAVVGTVHK